MEAGARALEDAELHLPLKVQEPEEGSRLRHAQVVAGEEPHPPAPVQHVPEMLLQEGHAGLQGEGHGDVHPGGPVQMGEEVGEEGIVGTPRHQRRPRPGIRERGKGRQVVPPGGDDVAHASPGVRDVPRVAGNHMDVEMVDGLTRALAHVHADVVAVGAEAGDRLDRGS